MTPQFLYSCEKEMLKKGMSPATVSMRTRCIKRLFNVAINNKDIDPGIYPFGDSNSGLYRPPDHKNIKKALNKTEIQRKYEYQPIQGSPEHFYRDLWFFSYLCNGMNLADICRLKYKHIDGDNIVFIRHKTAHNRLIKPVLVPITQYVKDIIERWGTKPKFKDNYIFPILTPKIDAETEVRKIKSITRMLNSHMNRIAKAIGLSKQVTSYTARHSFASILKRAGGSATFIADAMGHKDPRTTDKYLGDLDDDTHRKIAKIPVDFS